LIRLGAKLDGNTPVLSADELLLSDAELEREYEQLSDSERDSELEIYETKIALNSK
jgi:hypothetical protein